MPEIVLDEFEKKWIGRKALEGVRQRATVSSSEWLDMLHEADRAHPNYSPYEKQAWTKYSLLCRKQQAHRPGLSWEAKVQPSTEDGAELKGATAWHSLDYWLNLVWKIAILVLLGLIAFRAQAQAQVVQGGGIARGQTNAILLQGRFLSPIAPTANQVIKWNATTSRWEPAAGGGASPLTTKGDLFTFTTVDARLPVGANGLCLTADSAQTTGLLWSACGSGATHNLLSATHPDTTAATVVRGDLVVGQSAIPSWQRLAIGANNTFLGSNATDAAWTAPTGGGSVLGTGRALTGGAGIAAIGDLSVDRTISTASNEANFLSSGALTCGAATQGKAQVHTTPLQYCDNAATPALQYAAYGDSSGNALSGDSATAFFSAGTVEDARLPSGLARDTEVQDGSLIGCQDAGATDAYACNLSPAPGAYTTGMLVQFKANTANTGIATINFNSLGAKTIKKFTSASPGADLADNDIRAGQWVVLAYDGTNFQMQSALGNAAAGGGGGDSITVNGAAVVDANFADATPAAPKGLAANIAFQKDTSSPANISGYFQGWPAPWKRHVYSMESSTTTLDNGTGFQFSGLFSGTPDGTVSQNAPTASDPHMTQYATAATTGSNAGTEQSDIFVFRWGRNLSFHTYDKISATTSIRYWNVVTGGGTLVGVWLGSDDPVQHAAGFRFSTVAADVNWMCYSNDNVGGGTITSSGVAVTTNGTRFEMIADDSVPNIKFYIDGTLVCTHTTNLPASGTNMDWKYGIRTQEAVAKNVQRAWGWFVSDK